MEVKNWEVDLVYLWVDGHDPQWIRKRNKAIGQVDYDLAEANSEGRYTDNDELRYSLRSVEKYVPWIRRIFIVTDDQVPHWLKLEHPKITVVNQAELLPEEANPCFNSNVIEYFLYKIPGLSEHFLYANDDMFFNAELTPAFFFKADGYPVVRLKRKLLGKWHIRFKRWVGKEIGQYREVIEKSALLVEKKFGQYFSGVPHHNVDAYKKTDYQMAVEEVFGREINPVLQNRFRSNEDVQRFAFSLYAVAIGHAHLVYVDNKSSLRMLLFKGGYDERLEKNSPGLFCMNDGHKASPEDRLAANRFLKKYFPEKSAFEL